MKEKGVEAGLQKEIAKSWLRDECIPEEPQLMKESKKMKLVREDEKHVEDEKELNMFIKGSSAFQHVGSIRDRGRRKSLDRESVQTEEVSIRSDSSEPRLSKDLKMQRAIRSTTLQHAIRSVLYTNELEGVLHEHRVRLD